ncbi:unnamed protein product [Trichobilharzia regenti]|nr:unnamed protein product [Trichobilharzia regenti]
MKINQMDLFCLDKKLILYSVNLVPFMNCMNVCNLNLMNWKIIGHPRVVWVMFFKLAY